MTAIRPVRFSCCLSINHSCPYCLILISKPLVPPLLLHPDGAARQGGIPRRQGAVEKERPGGEPVSRPGHEAAPLPQWRTAGAGR